MLGLMQDFPLIIPRLLDYAERYHSHAELVSRRLEGDLHRYTWSALGRRSRQLAQALEGLGVGPGDVVGTLAWNGYRHMELYYAVPGMQAVYHTINPRLSVPTPGPQTSNGCFNIWKNCPQIRKLLWWAFQTIRSPLIRTAKLQPAQPNRFRSIC